MVKSLLVNLIVLFFIPRNLWAETLIPNHDTQINQAKAYFLKSNPRFDKFSQFAIAKMELMTKYGLKAKKGDKKIPSIFDPSFLRAVIFLLPREIYSVNTYDELIETLEAAHNPPKGWKWGEIVWNEFRKEMLELLKKHKVLMDNALKYYVKEISPNFFVSLASIQNIKKDSNAVVDFSKINVMHLISITKSKGDIKTLKEYLRKQALLPQLFPFSEKAQENWEKFRSEIIKS